jgi:hypothetical protein
MNGGWRINEGRMQNKLMKDGELMSEWIKEFMKYVWMNEWINEGREKNEWIKDGE